MSNSSLEQDKVVNVDHIPNPVIGDRIWFHWYEADITTQDGQIVLLVVDSEDVINIDKIEDALPALGRYSDEAIKFRVTH